MSFELGHLFFAALVYLLVLFFIAYATEQGWIPQRIARHPVTYALSLGVYATSWSFYGSVGFAQTQGFNFLSIYIGVTLAFMLAPVLLAPILRIARDYQLTSLADVLSFRYRSQTAGVLVTLFMLLGTFPYIALQILAVTESIQILTQEATPQVLALGFCVTLTLFAILFGARHISPREKHEGLVVAIAFESMIKLVALCAVGVFALFGVFGGFGGLGEWLGAHPQALEGLRAGDFVDQMPVDVENGGSIPQDVHQVPVPDLVEQGARFGHGSGSSPPAAGIHRPRADYVVFLASFSALAFSVAATFALRSASLAAAISAFSSADTLAANPSVFSAMRARLPRSSRR